MLDAGYEYPNSPGHPALWCPGNDYGAVLAGAYFGFLFFSLIGKLFSVLSIMGLCHDNCTFDLNVSK